jgi:hypothetical protein
MSRRISRDLRFRKYLFIKYPKFLAITIHLLSRSLYGFLFGLGMSLIFPRSHLALWVLPLSMPLAVLIEYKAHYIDFTK